MKKIRMATLGLGVALLAAAPVAMAVADEFTPAQKAELSEFIKDYLIKNPDVLRAAIDSLEKHEKQIAENSRRTMVSNKDGALYNSPFQATIGNPQGTATLVEFFDYNCHFCKGALNDMAKLVHDDPNLRLVLKDFPVLGPGSVEAAKVASAVRQQLPGDKFWAFHNKLLSMKGPIGEAEALAVAKSLNLDMDKLAKDMANPQIDSGLHEVMAMADQLQINGTPSFVLGDEVIVGAGELDELRDKISAVHKCGHAVC